MLKNKKILLTILMVALLLLIPNIVKADDENIISSITITVPEPVLGEKPATKDNVTVKGNGTINFEVTQIVWEFVEENEQGIGGGEMQPNDVFEKDKNYQMAIEYKIPEYYTIKNDLTWKVNGRNLQSKLGGVDGPENGFYNCYDGGFEFGKAKAKITYNTDDVGVFVPLINGRWGEIGTGAIVAPGETLSVRPMKEAESWEVTVQGASGACGTVEKADNNGKLPYYEFTMPAENVEVTAKYIGLKENETANEAATEESKAEETKEEKTEEAKDTKDTSKAPGTIPHAGGTLAIIASAMLLIAGGIYVFRKNNDLKGI